MNKIVLIFFSLLLLNSTTEMHQLWKLPLLAQHYKEHNKKMDDIKKRMGQEGAKMFFKNFFGGSK